MATVSIRAAQAPAKSVTVPPPASRATQVLAALVLLGLTAFLGVLLGDAIKDDQASTAVLLALALVLPVAVLVLWRRPRSEPVSARGSSSSSSKR